MKKEYIENGIKFYYRNFSEKRLKSFVPSKTLGEELRLQRNYYDLVKLPKTTTTTKANKLKNFLQIVDDKEILNKLENITSLEEYLKYTFNRYADFGDGNASRISELENETNPKLESFNRDNYFTSYYFLFTLYGFLDFNSLLKLLYRYNVHYRYSSTKIQNLRKCIKTEFNVYQKSLSGYSLYSLIKPCIKEYNVHQKVELSFMIGEPSYFIEDFLQQKITTITYETAKRLINIIGIKFTNNITVDDLLYSFGMLNDRDVLKEKEIEDYLNELDFERYQIQNNLTPINFNYIYKKDTAEEFTFLGDLQEMVSQVNNNLLKFVNDSCSVYDIDSILNAFKVLTTLQNMSKNMLESTKLLSLPLNEDVNRIVKYYEDNISKKYYAEPFNITLLDDIEPSEDEKAESLNVCIPKLVIDKKENSNKYTFDNYFKEIYKKT